MRNVKKFGKKLCAATLAAVMVLSGAISNIGTVAQVQAAEEMEGFIEVEVPNGDFEDGETTWTFTGNDPGIVDDSGTEWRVFDCTSSNNQTKVYETCNKTGTEELYTCSQTVTGLKNGVYKASIQGMGGNDKGGTHTTSFTAGGKTVAVTPAAWNNWITYTTDVFEVTDGTCELVISSAVMNNYVNMDNVTLWRQDDGSGKEVQSVSPVSTKVKVGGTFTAPTQATVLFDDGTSSKFDVTWDAAELAKVVTTAAATFTVPGKVTVNEKEYDVTMTVTVVDGSELIQTIPEDAQGAVDFDTNWQFYLATRTPEENGKFATGGVKDAGDYTTAEIVATSFDDASWRTVDVPHDFSIEGEKTSKSKDSQGYLQGGLGYYRKTFVVPESLNGKRFIIDFEGVYQNSIVYLNGEEVGNYPNGYTGFAFDITDKIVYGGQNVLVVKVQNMSPSGRWYTGSGIVRPVHLMVENSARFSRNGITLSTPSLKSDLEEYEAAYLTVDATAQTEDSNSNVYMEVTVYDAEGNEVAKAQTENTALNAGPFALQKELEIASPQLWYPWNLGTPYLYTVNVALYQEKNGSDAGYVLVDEEQIEYGFRYFEVAETTSDANSGGLYVNGLYTKVQGVDLHHDSGALGAASYTDAYERQFDKLMDMGVNAYRTSHCPPSKQVIEVCRRKGILVFEEAFDGWGAAKATYDFGQFFLQEVPSGWAGLSANGLVEVPTPATNYDGAKYMWSDWVIREMVQRDKNEPSILAWSIGNEVRGAGSLPSWYKAAEYDILDSGSTNSTYTEAVRLAQEVRAQDDSRLVITGTDRERSVPAANAEYGLVNQVLDGLGLNYNTAKSVDGLINRYTIGDGTLYEKGSKTFFFESESSSQTSSRGVYLDPQFSNTGINQTPGSRGGSNYDNDFASWTMSNEYGLKKDRDRKSFIGQFIWTGFDYIGEPTPYSVFPVGVASFGTIDTAGFPKDSFYLYKSQWVKAANEPMVHLLPTDWDSWKEGETVTVWVNSNLPSAELFLNGKSLGKKSFDEKETAYGTKYYETSEATADDKTWGDSSNSGGYTSKGAKVDDGETNYGKLHLTWEVPYEAGTLSVVAYDETGAEAATDSVSTSDIPYTISTEVNETVLAADGSSLSYVECTVVDEYGNMVADADDLVKFDVEGPVSIVGVDNGQQESTELYKWENVDKNTHSERSAYHGKVLVILKSERETGDAVLTVSADNLKPAQVNIKVTEDGGSDVPVVQPEITGTATTIDPVAITVPTGMSVTLPATVKVNYTSTAGDYSVLRPVEWGNLTNGTAEGTVEGVTAKATATVTESAEAVTDVELATNTTVGSTIFDFADVEADSEAAGKALATATFTGATDKYPNNMLDGKDTTSWTNAYSRGASVLLPANSASRASDYVEFFWNEEKVLNQVSLSFVKSKSAAVPSELEVQYWDGRDWATVADQITVVAAESKLPTVMQFAPVYTDRVRVRMVNGTPFTSGGNIEIVEASVMLSSAEPGVQIIMEADKTKVELGGTFTVTGRMTNLPDGEEALLKSVSFVLDYDAAVFGEPTVALIEGVPGTLTSTKDGDKTVWTYANESGIPASVTDFMTATFTAGEEVEPGNYTVQLSSIVGTDTAGETVGVAATAVAVSVVGAEIYLSDIEWVSAVSGWQNVNKDLNCNGDSSSTIAMKIAGEKQEFEKGLGTHADSEIIYDLSNYSALRFQAYVGIDYFKVEANKNGDGVIFRVYGDDVLLHESATLDTNADAEFIDVSVAGVKTLKLVVDKVGTNGHDNANWADAKLLLGKPVPAESITLGGDAIVDNKITMDDGTEQTFTATILPANSTDQVTWASSDENVVKVTGSTANAEGVRTGTLEAVAPGTATITVTAGSKTATVQVEVKAVAPTGITLNKTEYTLKDVGKTTTLKATVAPDNVTDATVTWTSSDEKIATVTDKGKVTAVAAGTATITATTINDLKATCVITVEVTSDDPSDPSDTPSDPTGTPTDPTATTPTPTPAPTNPTTAPTVAPTQATEPAKEAFTSNNPGLPSGKSEESKSSKYSVLAAKVTKTAKNSQTLKWKKVAGADGYVVLGNMCNAKGKKYKFEVLKVINKNSTTKFVHKKLKKGTFYKYLVQAYKVVDGKVKIVSTSKTMHSTTKGGKYNNPTSIKVQKASITLKAKKSQKIKASVVGKKQAKHRAIMYESSDTKVATVSAKGVVKAKKKGKCIIYVYGQNGVCKNVKVNVK